MKILRLTTLLDFGGQEKQILSFTENKSLLKNEYVFASIGYGGYAEKILKNRGFEVHTLNQNFSIRNLTNIYYVYRLIKKVNPDVVHTAAAEANLYGIMAAKLAGVKIVIGEEIGLPSHSKYAIKIFSWVYKKANSVICVSNAVKNFLIDIGEISSEKGKVIYNPVSLPINHPKNNSTNFHIVYVGRLEVVKNVKTLINAFAKLNYKNIRLTIVGEGRERNNLEEQVRNLNVNREIEFVGFSDDPAIYLEEADLFVLPSYSEGFGIAAVEAMFLKVPVLCSKVGGIPEFIDHDHNGWLFDPQKEEELKLTLEYIVDLTKKDLINVGLNGYNSVIEKFTVQSYVYNLEKHYKSLL